MRRVYKYPVPDIGTVFTVNMPAGAQVVNFETQGEQMCFWAVVDPSARAKPREFTVFGTGWDIEDDRWRYVASLQDPPYVWHLFEKGDIPTGDKHG
jgi:hypothetical protein